VRQKIHQRRVPTSDDNKSKPGTSTDAHQDMPEQGNSGRNGVSSPHDTANGSVPVQKMEVSIYVAQSRFLNPIL